MNQDKLLEIIMDSEPGNHAETIYITQQEYDELKREFKTNFNCFHGPFGPVWLKVKK